MDWLKSRTNQGALIGGIFLLIAAIISEIPWSSDDPLPEFRLVKGASYHPDSILVVQAVNESAQKNKRLDFDIDGFWFKAIALPSEIDDSLFWHINLSQMGLPDTVRHDGVKVVHFGFSRERLSAPMKIYFDSRPPQAYVGYAGQRDNEKTIFGKVVDDGAEVQQPVSVEVSFRHHERLRTLQLPVREIVDENGRHMFEFEYQVQNFPLYSATDSEYQQSYFQLTVRDAAGNEFRQESTYNAFVVAGEQRFGYRDAQILLQKYDPERSSGRMASASARQLPPAKSPVAVSPLLVLRVVIRAHDYVQLSWTRLPSHLLGDVEEYSVLRSNQVIGASFDTTFTDRAIMPNSSYHYQVVAVARGKERATYTSNIVPSAARPDSVQVQPAPIDTKLAVSDSASLSRGWWNFIMSRPQIFGLLGSVIALVGITLWVAQTRRKQARRIHVTILSPAPLKKTRQSVRREERVDPQMPIASASLRSKPVESLPGAAVKSMLRKMNFFHSTWHRKGKGFKHQYEVVTRSSKKLVIDHMTGLTWQQAVSEYGMTYSNAKVYVEDLNHGQFAGFSDWRLPTLDEAMSLMEPSQTHHGQHINPVFDINTSNDSIWTADQEAPGIAWYVSFFYGKCDYYPVAGNLHVRAVRSGQS